MRVLVVEDHPIYSAGFQTILNRLDPAAETVAVASAEQALVQCDTNSQFDLCVVDLTLPGMGGVTLIESLVVREFWFPVIVVSAEESVERISRAMSAGALGYISKSSSADDTLAAIRRVLAGHVSLPERIRQQMSRMRRQNDTDIPGAAASLGITPRQYRVLQLIASGLSNAQIAGALNVTEHTIKSHVRGLFQALGADNRTACVHVAAKKGLVGGSSMAT